MCPHLQLRHLKFKFQASKPYAKTLDPKQILHCGIFQAGSCLGQYKT